MSRRRWLVPEVVQSSAMDCGPAALKSLLAGHSIQVAYDRLREACHTDVDGSSIDVLEDVAVSLGLDAAQVLEPVEHVFLPEAELLPAIGVVRLPDGLTHFIVIWRRHGPMVQVMDPAVGRRWVTVDELRDELHRHEQDVPATAFREYAASDKFLAPLRRRLVDLGVGSRAIGRLVATATSDDGWEGLAALDGAIRLCKEWIDSGAARPGPEAETLVSRFAREGNQWLAHKAAAAAGPAEGMLRLRGTVLISVAGRREASSEEVGSPSPEPAASSTSPEASGLRELWRLLRTDGALGPGVVIVSVAAAAVSTVLEAVIWRSLLDLARIVRLGSAQLAGLVSIFAFLVGSLLVDVATFAAGLRMGRRLETRLRIALLAKIPLLADRYFATRPRSDMAERSHSVHALSNSAVRAAELIRHAFQLLATAGAIIWIDRQLAFAAVAAAALALLVPLCALPPIQERDMRIRVHGGALTRFALDAFLGLVAIRAHGAEATMRRSHDDLLVEWLRAVRRRGRTVVAVDTLQTLLGLSLAAWLVLSHVGASGVDGTVLLVAYWALELPRLGQATLSGLRGLAEQRNILARVLEPLGSVEDEAAKALPARDASRAGATAPAAHVVFVGVTVRAAGQTILREVDLEIPAGSHVAIVGASGAGKSTLVGVLLGFHRPAAGTILVDGRPLDEDGGLARLRSETVWVDSSVQIWNRTLLDNVVSGCERDALDLTAAMEHGDLRSLCASLPEGLQTVLGDGGAHLSEGEGQRVRLLRAFCRRGSRLVLLDEAFGGLARAERREHLARARDAWRDRTLLCVTHDIGETRDFPRVLVVEDGQVVEDGRPDELLGRRASRYRRLMEAEHTLLERVLGGPGWRRLRIHRGRLRP